MSNALNVIAGACIILFLVIIIPAVIFGIGPFIKKHFSLKINFFIISGYLAVLILLSFVCFLLPGCALVNSEKPLQVTDNATVTNTMVTLLNRIKSSGDFSPPSGYKIAEKKFVPQGSSLKVMTENYDAEIDPFTKGVDIADNKDGKIDVYCYTLVNEKVSGTNLSIKNQTPAIKYYNNESELRITNKRRNAIDLYQFSDANSASQFINTDNSLDMPSGIGNIVVVILPKGVKINETCSISG